MLSHLICSCQTPGAPGHAYAYRVALYDRRRRGTPGPKIYRARAFRSYATNAAGLTMATRYRPIQVFEFTLFIGLDSNASFVDGSVTRVLADRLPGALVQP